VDLKHAELRSSELRRVLGALSEEVVELGPRELAAGVPGDAAIVVVPGPSTPLQPAEWTALERYLDRGGRLLIALDPTGATSMGALEGRLGLRMLPGHLVDDKAFLPARGTLSDRRLVVTTQFSAHPSTAALARAAGKGLVLIDAGALEETPFTSKGQAPRRTITIRSMESAWLDLDQPQDFTFDAATEQRRRWNLAAAVEGPKLAGKGGFRALVFSDAELFADVLVKDPQGRPTPILVSGPLLADSIRWLGGDGWAMRDPGTTTARPGDAPDDSAPSPPPKAPQITPPIDVTRPPADAIRTASGLVYKVLVANPAGAVAKRNDTVLINHTGWRQRTGETFYSSRSRGQPMPLDLSSAAPGFVEALQLLKQGEKAMLWISPALGTRGGTAPPPDADTLVYELEIADIQRAPEVPADLKAPPANTRSLRSGTRYVVLRPGTGTQKARSFDTVTYHVTWWDSDGRQHESTEMRQRRRRCSRSGTRPRSRRC
jgi:peptidylprolyl isomerase